MWKGEWWRQGVPRNSGSFPESLWGAAQAPAAPLASSAWALRQRHGSKAGLPWESRLSHGNLGTLWECPAAWPGPAWHSVPDLREDRDLTMSQGSRGARLSQVPAPSRAGRGSPPGPSVSC